jgi:hypothetical protein
LIYTLAGTTLAACALFIDLVGSPVRRVARRTARRTTRRTYRRQEALDDAL